MKPNKLYIQRNERKYISYCPQSDNLKNRRQQRINVLSFISMIFIVIYLIVNIPICYSEDIGQNKEQYNNKENFNDSNNYNEINMKKEYYDIDSINYDYDLDDSLRQFYGFDNADDDYDYTASTQTANIYISNLTDVTLCLLCTFFWVLWLVGTIFPNKIQDLYRNDGVVVKGDIVDCYCVDNDNSEGYGVGIATYRTVVSYVVPGKVVRGRRETFYDVKNKHSFLFEKDNSEEVKENPTKNQINSHNLTPKNLPEANKKSTANKSDIIKEEISNTNDYSMNQYYSSPDGTHFSTTRTKLNNNVIVLNKKNKAYLKVAKSSNSISLFDSVPNSFEGSIIKYPSKNEKPKVTILYEEDFRRKYTNCNRKFYNRKKQSVENSSIRQINEDIVEQDPEQIGNCFEIFGLSHIFPTKKTESNLIKDRGPVRVKKRFETSEFLYPGKGNVEILVLPGNPTSGILKSEFDEHEYMLDESRKPNKESGKMKQTRRHVHKLYEDPKFDGEQQMIYRNNSLYEFNIARKNDGSTHIDQFTTAAIGVVLVAVSTIGAVNAALKLPYNTRAFGWMFLVTSLTFMWPLAMWTYKTVHRLRIFMMNKIISFEPCVEKTGLYNLSKLPTVELNCSSSKLNNLPSRTGSLVQESDYFIMMDSSIVSGEKKKGVFSQDEDSAISSLSGDGRNRRIV